MEHKIPTSLCLDSVAPNTKNILNKNMITTAPKQEKVRILLLDST